LSTCAPPQAAGRRHFERDEKMWPVLLRTGRSEKRTVRRIDWLSARSPPSGTIQFDWSAQHPCRVPSMGKRRVGASSKPATRVLARGRALRAAPVAGFDPLTGRSKAVGRAVPPPTLFRRIHAYSVRSDWPVCSPSAEGEPSPNRSTQEEATNGSQISAPEILDLRL